MQNKTHPVLIICFNRPDKTRKIINSLRINNIKKIFISQDGPRKNNSKDEERCNLVLKEIQAIDWDCEVKYRVHEENQGCRNGVISAIDWFFEENDAGIILEDDCMPADNYFNFMEFCLKEYIEERNISSATGTNLMGFYPLINSHGFSYYGHVWGWCTWRRVWKDFRATPKEVLENYLYSDNFKKIQIYNPFLAMRWKRNFRLEKQDKISAWDIDWMIYKWYKELYTIVPQKNLIINIGFDGEATNTKQVTNNQFNPMCESICDELGPLSKNKIIHDSNFDKLIAKEFNSDFSSFFSQICRRIVLDIKFLVRRSVGL